MSKRVLFIVGYYQTAVVQNKLTKLNGLRTNLEERTLDEHKRRYSICFPLMPVKRILVDLLHSEG